MPILGRFVQKNVFTHFNQIFEALLLKSLSLMWREKTGKNNIFRFLSVEIDKANTHFSSPTTDTGPSTSEHIRPRIDSPDQSSELFLSNLLINYNFEIELCFSKVFSQ